MKMKPFKCKTTNFAIWQFMCCCLPAFLTFLFLTACLIHEYVMLENTFLGVLHVHVLCIIIADECAFEVS